MTNEAIQLKNEEPIITLFDDAIYDLTKLADRMDGMGLLIGAEHNGRQVDEDQYRVSLVFREVSETCRDIIEKLEKSEMH